jgi:hypothetical protein
MASEASGERVGTSGYLNKVRLASIRLKLGAFRFRSAIDHDTTEPSCSRPELKARQRSLFDDALAPAETAALVSVPKGKERLSAAQRTFNRLTERIRSIREALATWDAFIPRFKARVVSELQPAERDVGEAQRRLVVQLDTLLAADKPGERLTRKQQTKVRDVLLGIAADILEQGEDPDVEGIYDRHSDVSYAVAREAEMELAEAALSELLGEDSVEGHEAQSVEELLQHASERLRETHAPDERGHARTRRRSKPTRDEQAKALAAQQATQSVREIYRKLVSALHPDRETDPAERARKTILMQRANQACERNDLLELLTLQIEIEQINSAALATLPEARLKHYNDVLKEQVQLLESQLRAEIAPFRFQFDLFGPVMPQHVDQALSGRIAEARLMIDRIGRTCEQLADARQRRGAIDKLPEPEDDEPGLSDLAMLAAAFGDGQNISSRVKRGPQRGRPRRKA